MKNIFKYVAVAAICTAMIGLVSCKKEDNTTSASKSYAFVYQGQTIEPNQTIDFHPTGDEVRNDFATVEFLIENKTSEELSSVMKVEKVEGPDALNDLMICYGATCKNGSCPWVSDPFTLVPGINQNMMIKLDYFPSNVTSKTVYRVTIGKGTSMSDPQVMLINVNAQ